MSYGELGYFSIISNHKEKNNKVLVDLLLGKISKLSYRLYFILYNDANANTYEFPWISNVKLILDDLGMRYICG